MEFGFYCLFFGTLNFALFYFIADMSFNHYAADLYSVSVIQRSHVLNLHNHSGLEVTFIFVAQQFARRQHGQRWQAMYGIRFRHFLNKKQSF